jgi:hypothetical protein
MPTKANLKRQGRQDLTDYRQTKTPISCKMATGQTLEGSVIVDDHFSFFEDI